jgi:hypothetical protein
MDSFVCIFVVPSRFAFDLLGMLISCSASIPGTIIGLYKQATNSMELFHLEIISCISLEAGVTLLLPRYLSVSCLCPLTLLLLCVRGSLSPPSL